MDNDKLTAPTDAPLENSDIDGIPQPYRFFSLAAVLLGIAVMVSDNTMIAAALPYLTQQLGISDSESIWLVSAYQMVVVITVLPLAALGETWGYKLIFRAGLCSFIVGGICCASSDSLPLLICGRILQGCGASAIYATMATIIRYSVSANQMGRAIGNNSLVVGITATVGPSIGALILGHLSWNALFLVPIPVALIALLCTFAIPTIPSASHRMRPVSALLSVVSLATLLFGIEALPTDPIKALPLIVTSFVVGAILVRLETRSQTYFVPIDLLRIPVTRLAAVASLCMFMSQMVANIGLPFYMLRSLEVSFEEMALQLALWPIAVAIIATLSGRLSDHYSTGQLATIGATILAFSLAAIAILDQPHIYIFTALCFMCGIGFGLFQSPNNRAMILSAPKHRTAGAGAVQALARQMGQSIGAAAAVGIFSLLPSSDGRWVLVLAAGAATCGMLISLKRLCHHSK